MQGPQRSEAFSTLMACSFCLTMPWLSYHILLASRAYPTLAFSLHLGMSTVPRTEVLDILPNSLSHLKWLALMCCWYQVGSSSVLSKCTPTDTGLFLSLRKG